MGHILLTSLPAIHCFLMRWSLINLLQPDFLHCKTLSVFAEPMLMQATYIMCGIFPSASLNPQAESPELYSYVHIESHDLNCLMTAVSWSL